MATTSDPTFQTYSTEAAQKYATHRLSYPQALYDKILDHHTSTGGQLDLILDVGCGPGNATRDVALSFDEAIGVDPGSAMIDAARSLGGKTKSGKDVRYEVCPAEEISKIEGLKEGSVDLLTSAMAAHWFDMSRFWAEAARIVKPGGTVALWTHASSFPHPSTPNYDKVFACMLNFERTTLAPYTVPGNLISMNMYDTLPLPWTLPAPLPPTIFSPSPSQYQKHDYDRNGHLSFPETNDFFGGSQKESLSYIEGGLGTASMVTRWREANPELVGTERDVLKVLMKELRELLGGAEELVRGSGTAILGFKRGEGLL